MVSVCYSMHLRHSSHSVHVIADTMMTAIYNSKTQPVETETDTRIK